MVHGGFLPGSRRFVEHVVNLGDATTPASAHRLRGKEPETIRREIWVHWLAYNLIRKVIAQAALTHEKLPRELSFASGLAAVTGACMLTTVVDARLVSLQAKAHHQSIASSWAGHRPNRVEPRAVKRRPKPHELLTRPREEARAKLMGMRV
jgi:hypothetical protein